MPIENPNPVDKWLCAKCRTYNAVEAVRCGWCGTMKPQPQPQPKPQPKPEKPNSDVKK